MAVVNHVGLCVTDLERSRRFYCDGFGWKPVFANEEIVFYQMNGFVLGTWLTKGLEGDMQRSGLARPRRIRPGAQRRDRRGRSDGARSPGAVRRPRPARGRRTAARRHARLHRRPRRSRLGNRLESSLADQPRRIRAVCTGLTTFPRITPPVIPEADAFSGGYRGSRCEYRACGWIPVHQRSRF